MIFLAVATLVGVANATQHRRADAFRQADEKDDHGRYDARKYTRCFYGGSGGLGDQKYRQGSTFLRQKQNADRAELAQIGVNFRKKENEKQDALNRAHAIASGKPVPPPVDLAPGSKLHAQCWRWKHGRRVPPPPPSRRRLPVESESSDMPGVYGMPGVTGEINDGMSGTTIMPGKTLPIKTRRRLQNNKHEESGDSETELAKILVTYLEMPATSRMFPSIALAKILYEKAKSFETPEISRITEYLEMPVIKKMFPTIALAKKLYEKVKSWGLRRRLQGKSDRRKLGVFSTLAGILPGMSNPINTAITEHHNTTRRKQDNEDENNFFSTCNALGSCNFCKGTGSNPQSWFGGLCPVCNGTGNAEGAAGLRKECIATFNDMNKSNNLSYATSPRGAVAAQATDLELQGEGIMMVRRRLLNCSRCQDVGTVPRKRKLGPNSIVSRTKCPVCQTTCPKCKGVYNMTLKYYMDPDESPSKCKRCEGTGHVSARRRLVLSGDMPAADTPSPSGNSPSPSGNGRSVFDTNGIGRERFEQLYLRLRAQQQHHLRDEATRQAFVELTTNNRGPNVNKNKKSDIHMKYSK